MSFRLIIFCSFLLSWSPTHISLVAGRVVGSPSHFSSLLPSCGQLFTGQACSVAKPSQIEESRISTSSLDTPSVFCFMHCCRAHSHERANSVSPKEHTTLTQTSVRAATEASRTLAKIKNEFLRSASLCLLSSCSVCVCCFSGYG